MFCSSCGKKILDSMQFCPFCGTKIVIPDQEVEEPREKAESIFDEPVEGPEPLKPSEEVSPDRSSAARRFVGEAKPTEERRAPADDKWEKESFKDNPEPESRDATPAEPKPVEKVENSFWAKPAEEAKSAERSESASQEIPKDELRPRARPRPADKPLNMFMEDDEEDEFDAFEAEQNRARNSAAYKENYGSRYRDSEEDDDEDGFFARHIRGIVALVLLVALIAAGAVYAMSDPGQMMLARLDLPLPLKADAYARLGYQHFNEGDFDRAGAYYERALARQPENYDYASTAANAYLKNENTVKAAEMLKKCIEMKPDAVEPYIYLLSLYPDKASRPGEVTRLLEQGYLRTNDERLKSE